LGIDPLERVMGLLLLCGFAAFCIGLISLTLRMLRDLEAPWEAMAMLCGLIFIALALAGAKLFARNW
jgi:hypothetical protein